MESFQNTNQTFHHTRDEFDISYQHEGARNKPGHQQGFLCCNKRPCFKGISSVCLGLLCILLLVTTVIQHFMCISSEEQLKCIQNKTVQIDNFLSDVDEAIQNRWWYYNLSVYYISKFEENMDWTTSRHFCRMKKADLVIINSFEEQKFIAHLCDIFQMDVWIGLKDRDNNGEWMWVDGTRQITWFWSPNQPINLGYQDCVESRAGFLTQYIFAGKRWNTKSCYCANGFICEKKMFI
ncbi:CD209 antigen-like protein E [Xyrauchen texanus]|uniref:CD209 antigen-like protein E n=1 Tax=Xyrauchen texanus TaxID=154827 RepID=UPI002241A090|nr:CD209 antigen-like protein E [Xyrauchen texanus]